MFIYNKKNKKSACNLGICVELNFKQYIHIILNILLNTNNDRNWQIRRDCSRCDWRDTWRGVSRTPTNRPKTFLVPINFIVLAVNCYSQFFYVVYPAKNMILWHVSMAESNVLYDPELVVEDRGRCHCVAFHIAEATGKRNTCLFFRRSERTVHELGSRRLPQMHTHTENTVIETCSMHPNNPADRRDRHHITLIFASSAGSMARCHDAHLRVEHDPFVYHTSHANFHGHGVDGVEGVVVKDILDLGDLCLSDVRR